MARMISGLFPQPAHTDPAIQAESEDSLTSDTIGKSSHNCFQFLVFQSEHKWCCNALDTHHCRYNSVSTCSTLPPAFRFSVGSTNMKLVFRMPKNSIKDIWWKPASEEAMFNMAFPSLVP